MDAHPPPSILRPPSSSVPLSQDGREKHRRRCVTPTKQNKWAGTRRALRRRGKNRDLSTTLGLFSPKFESVFNDSWGEVKAQMRFSLMVQLHVANNAVAVPRVPLWRLLLGKASITVRTISAGRWAAASDWYNYHIRQLDYLLCGDS